MSKFQKQNSEKKSVSQFNEADSFQDTEETPFIYKTQLIQTAIFTAIILALFALAASSVLISSSFWQDGLREKINTILLEEDAGFTAGEWCKVNSNLTSQLAVYKAEPGFDDQKMYVAITRITTVHGPLSAIFTVKQNAVRAQFITFCDLSPRTNENITDIAKKSQIAYWEEKLPAVTDALFSKEGE